MPFRIDTSKVPMFSPFDKAGVQRTENGPDGLFTQEDIPALSDLELDSLSEVVRRSNIGKDDADQIIKMIHIMKVLRSPDFMR